MTEVQIHLCLSVYETIEPGREVSPHIQHAMRALDAFPEPGTPMEAESTKDLMRKGYLRWKEGRPMGQGVCPSEVFWMLRKGRSLLLEALGRWPGSGPFGFTGAMALLPLKMQGGERWTWRA